MSALPPAEHEAPQSVAHGVRRKAEEEPQRRKRQTYLPEKRKRNARVVPHAEPEPKIYRAPGHKFGCCDDGGSRRGAHCKRERAEARKLLEPVEHKEALSAAQRHRNVRPPAPEHFGGTVYRAAEKEHKQHLGGARAEKIAAFANFSCRIIDIFHDRDLRFGYIFAVCQPNNTKKQRFFYCKIRKNAV